MSRIRTSAAPLRRGLLGLILLCLAIAGLGLTAPAAQAAGATKITPGVSFTLAVPGGAGSTASFTFTGEAGKNVVVQATTRVIPTS